METLAKEKEETVVPQNPLEKFLVPQPLPHIALIPFPFLIPVRSAILAAFKPNLSHMLEVQQEAWAQPVSKF